MRITFTPSVYQTPNYAGKSSASKTQKSTAQKFSNEISFNGFFSNLGYYFAQKLDKRREEKKTKQFKQVEDSIHEDIKFIAQRKQISEDTARQYYESMLDGLSIPLKKNGYESGLNGIIGYSLEKYKITKELLMPLMASYTQESNNYPVPNGILVYGPRNTGKTHFVQALGSHIEKKELGNYQKAYIYNTDFENDNPERLIKYFDDAQEEYYKTGKRQVLFFDDIEDILDEDYPNLKNMFIALSENCSKRGITWIGVSNAPRRLPDILFKKSRLNSDIYINHSSDAEKSAVMSYFWKRNNRLDNSNHDKLLEKYDENSYFHFFPPEMEKVAEETNSYLEEKKDRDSHLSKYVKVKSPITTDLVDEKIQEYIHSIPSEERSQNAVLYINADESQIYVTGKRGEMKNAR